MGDTKIEWTNKTWNPVRGCSVVSEGCRNCYAMTFAARFAKEGEPFAGLAYRNESGAHWTGKVRVVKEHLEDPLRWRKPAMVFVNSMSDLFHESLTDTDIQNVFSVIECARRHTFQILTKRPTRMLEFVKKFDEWLKYASDHPGQLSFASRFAHVWLGVSVEDQKTADERIPLLLQTPAAVRWISAEPLLGPVDLKNMRSGTFNALDGIDFEDIGDMRDTGDLSKSDMPGLDWVVVGGESGPKSRPFDLAWARSIVAQCQAANVPVFVKQLGANPFYGGVNCGDGNENFDAHSVTLADKKGGDINEWPQDLQVREFPAGHFEGRV